MYLVVNICAVDLSLFVVLIVGTFRVASRDENWRWCATLHCADDFVKWNLCQSILPTTICWVDARLVATCLDGLVSTPSSPQR